eukprot:102832-Pleurochrysis_carterae.AAC.2
MPREVIHFCMFSQIVAEQMVYGPRTKLGALSPAEIERCTRLPPPPEPRLNSVSRQACIARLQSASDRENVQVVIPRRAPCPKSFMKITEHFMKLTEHASA